MYTPFAKLMLEAVVVAIMFVVLGALVHLAAMKLFKDKAMKDHTLLASQAALTAAIFHIICEYTHINSWYCKNRLSKK